MYEFAKSTMKDPAPSRYQSVSVKVKWRIFFLEDGNILRNTRDRYFKEVRGKDPSMQSCQQTGVVVSVRGAYLVTVMHA